MSLLKSLDGIEGHHWPWMAGVQQDHSRGLHSLHRPFYQLPAANKQEGPGPRIEDAQKSKTDQKREVNTQIIPQTKEVIETRVPGIKIKRMHLRYGIKVDKKVLDLLPSPVPVVSRSM